MSMVTMVMALSLGQIGPEPPTVVIQLPRGAILTIERLQPVAPVPAQFPNGPQVAPEAVLSGASVVQLPPNTVLTVRVNPNRSYSPVFRPGTPMIIALPGGGMVNVDSIVVPTQPGIAPRASAPPYAVVLYEASRLVLEVPPEQPVAPMPTPQAYGVPYNAPYAAPAYAPSYGPFRFRN